jgi:hypothetical protein
MEQEISVMQVIRIPPRGKLMVEADGRRYQSLAEVTHAPTRQRLLAAIGELVSFAGSYENLVNEGLAPPILPPATLAPEVSGDEALEEQRARFLAALEHQRDVAQQAAAMARPSMIPLPGRRPEPPLPDMTTSASTTGPLSVAKQIDAILQKHLAADPALANRDIHLTQSDEGLRIIVDHLPYKRPADIPDKQVQLLLKMALQEWESRQ